MPKTAEQSAPSLRDLNVEKWPIQRLLPYARNARTHSDEQIAQIAASILEFNWTNPILVGPDAVVIAGARQARRCEAARDDRGARDRAA